jgi:hypothetical protein
LAHRYVGVYRMLIGDHATRHAPHGAPAKALA